MAYHQGAGFGNPNQMPTDYKGWLSRLYSVNSLEEIIDAAKRINQLAQDKNKARGDVAVVLATKYREDKDRAEDNLMMKNLLNKKYDTLGKMILGVNSVHQMLAYADKVSLSEI